MLNFLRAKKSRRLLLAALALLLFLGLLAFLFAPQILCVDTGDVQADAMVVLGGGYGERVDRAAELFKAGAAPRLILTGAGDAIDNKRLLEARGVPSGVIELEAASKSTKQNALFTIPMLRAQGARRVILVTSWYHSRRSLNCFRHYGPGTEFFSRPSYAGCRTLGRGAQMNRLVVVEYVKVVGYWVCYGVRPF
jgi:uncharacterized SAM-binding protein YcdF (DUF218 family)